MVSAGLGRGRGGVAGASLSAVWILRFRGHCPTLGWARLVFAIRQLILLLQWRVVFFFFLIFKIFIYFWLC